MSETITPGRTTAPRQKRARARRAELLAAVERIVAAEGPEAVTTTRVATETGAAVGTIYRYFEGREQMLLSAYDDTVRRIVEQCRDALEELPSSADAEDAARVLLGHYLAAAEAIPAHSGLLRAMRGIRPIAADQRVNADGIVGEIFVPFLARFAPGASFEPVALNLMNVTVGTLVDLYLVTEGAAERAYLRDEIEAHVAFMVARAIGRR